MSGKIKQITIAGVFAAIYVVLCLALGNLSYMGVQIRLATLIEPLPFYFCKTKEDKRISLFAIFIGVIVANSFSPLGIIDVIFGVVEEALVLIVFYDVCLKSPIRQTIFYAGVNAILVSLELYYVYNIPYLYSVVTVGIPAIILYYIGTKVMKEVSNQIYKHLAR